MSGKMTIDELAREAGTTTRNIRAYQTKGVLEPPDIVGRIGYYGDNHLTRLKLISRLQQRGFGLAAISDLLDAWDSGASLSEVLGFQDALLAPWSDEAPEKVSKQQLEALFPDIVSNPDLIEKAKKLDLLAEDEDGYSLPSPRLAKVGAKLVSIGVPLSAVLAQAELMKDDIDNMAMRLVAMFSIYVWEPFMSGETPDRSLADVTEILQEMRPLAAEAVSVFLARAMEAATEAAALEDLKHQLEGTG